MGSSRKRGRQDVEAVADIPIAAHEPSLLERIRNMWEFANLAQWIYIFGKAVKIDEDLDIEDLEMECLKSSSTVLSDIGLALLKFVSSHRGLTPELFDEYTRRQYVAKAPKRNPFGTDEDPAKFSELDIFTKIRVLQQLTQWSFGNPDRVRERMEEQKDTEQASWRIEPFGWDSEDRTYIVLDDNRLYRLTDPPEAPPPKAAPKKNSKKSKASRRASKRRKLSEGIASEDEVKEEEAVEEKTVDEEEYDGFGGKKWECLAVTLEELNAVVASFAKTKDPNEKTLRQQITDNLLPLLEKAEEARRRKEAQREKELLNLEKLATAKRSGRIAGKLEQQKKDEEAREAERKHQADLLMARKEQDKWRKLEKERESRMQTREQRLKEREAKRILHEEELAGLSEDSKKLEIGEGRLSERHLKAEIERKRQALEQLEQEEDWVFDCICGAYGQVDDGTHSIACEKCNIWQHTKCVGASEEDAGRDDFHFICKSCKQREREARRRAKEAEEAKNRPAITIKFNRPGSSSSAIPAERSNGAFSQSPALGQPHSLAQYQSSPVPQPSSHTGYSSPYANGTQAMVQQHPPPKMAAWPTSTAPRLNGVPSPIADKAPSVKSFQNPPNISGSSPHRQNAFSPPPARSPTSLPPPAGPHNYAQASFVTSAYSNGNSTVALARATETSNSPPQATSSFSSNDKTPRQLSGQPANGQSFEQRPRQSSASFASPFASAPIFQQSPSYNDSRSTNGNNTGNGLSNFSQSTALPSPAQSFSTPAPHSQNSEDDHGHLSALPPASTGISPTKHSPPRPVSSNGLPNIMGLSTPLVLPPVASLTPSPQQPNLTPPVKASVAPLDPATRSFGSPSQQQQSSAMAPPVSNTAAPPVNVSHS